MKYIRREYQAGLRCVVPTENDAIEVKITTRDGRKIFEYRVPPGCEVIRRMDGAVRKIAKGQGSFALS